MTRIRELRGLGPQSEKLLSTIGVATKSDLERLGPIRAYLKLSDTGAKPSMNLLYAMVGALTDQSWLDVAKNERVALLLELEGFADLKRMLEDEGQSLEG